MASTAAKLAERIEELTEALESIRHQVNEVIGSDADEEEQDEE